MRKRMEYVWLYPKGKLCEICTGLDMSPKEVADGHGPGSWDFDVYAPRKGVAGGRIALVVY